ncbi:MAG TPA: hypothetical protein VGE74_23050 [Gemmata sp.]
MRSICVFAVALSFCVAVGEMPAAAPVPKGALKRGPVSCAIKGEATCELGKAPQITVALTNLTDADIYLVGSLDASDCKWRYPHCYFEVIGPDGKSAVRETARCGNMNPLLAKDFVKVPAGKAFDPYQRTDQHGFFSARQLSPQTFRELGKYRIRFVYSTKSDDIGNWGGDGRRNVVTDKALVDLLKQVPKVEIRSDEFTLTVVAPAK